MLDSNESGHEKPGSSSDLPREVRLPLTGVRIVAVEQYGAGPFGTSHLADLGADVIKVEDPTAGGDVGRVVPPYAQGGDSLFFQTFNRNKKSIALDMKTDCGRQVFEDLVRVSDGVYSNLRGDVPEQLGLTYAQLCHLNPAIVCCSLTGFGMTGPRRAQPGYDYVLQALSGWMSLTGDPEGPPTKSGLSVVDYSSGIVAALALMSGLIGARATGVGMDCDVSLYDTSINYLTYLATWQMNTGYQPARHRQSAHPSIVPFQAFEASDGWLIVGCPKEKFWQRLVAVLDDPDLHDTRFATLTTRLAHREAVLEIIERNLARRTVSEWIGELESAGVPCAPVNSVEDAMRDPHTIARGLIIETESPTFGTVRQLASPVRVGPARTAHRPAPALNQHADYVLKDLLEYDDDSISAFAEGGAFG